MVLKLTSMTFEYELDDVLDETKHVGGRIDSIIDHIRTKYPHETEGMRPVVQTDVFHDDGRHTMLVSFQPERRHVKG